MIESSKVAFIHDWLVEFGGAEQNLSALLSLWPEATIYTLVHDPIGPCASVVASSQLVTSFIQKLPGSPRKYRRYLPLMPLAVEQFNLVDYELIISNSYAVAKGVLSNAAQFHLCYIQSPIRYAWDLQNQYLKEARLERGLRGFAARLLLHYIRLWDLASSNRVDEYVANSHYTARRVYKIYRRPAKVIYPPVDVKAFTARDQKDNYYITISRLVPYKKIDIIIEAFNQMPEKHLIIIGDGPDREKLQSIAGKNVEFMNFQPFDVIKERLQRARALIFAAVEDFGIVPVEAQACGTPVIAYAKGGALETVIENRTGLFFYEQSAESLKAAIETFEGCGTSFDINLLRENAERFSKERFQLEFRNSVEESWSRFIEQGQYL